MTPPLRRPELIHNYFQPVDNSPISWRETIHRLLKCGMEAHRIDLRPDLRPGGKQHGPTPMLYRGNIIGSSDQPEYAGARWLLDNGKALPEDKLETWRGETLCVSGIIGKLAKLTVVENGHGDPTFQLRTYKPFPTETVRLPAAKTPSQVQKNPGARRPRGGRMKRPRTVS
jgi:hypothetical protein